MPIIKQIFKKGYFASIFLILAFLLSACNFHATTASPQIEETIFAILTGEDKEEAKASKILDVIQNIDWHKFELVSGDNSIDLLKFIQQNLSMISEERELNLLSATSHLDGIYAEIFSSIVWDLYVKDQRRTINLISRVDSNKQDDLVGFLLYNADEPLKGNLVKSDMAYLESLDLNSNEREIVNKISDLLPEYPIS